MHSEGKKQRNKDTYSSTKTSPYFRSSTMFFILIGLTLANAQDIRRLDDNPGLYIQPLGYAKISYSHWTIIKPYELSEIQNEISNLKNVAHTFLFIYIIKVRLSNISANKYLEK